MQKKKIAIIGCGAIGSAIAMWISEKASESVSAIALYDTDGEKLKQLESKVALAEAALSPKDAVMRSDILIEAANPMTASEVLTLAIDNKKDVMILSIGGLADKTELLGEASKTGITVILPSGAVAGIDAVKAANIAGIDSITLTTRKSPASLKGAPYLEKNGIDVDAIKKETVIFEGSASEAVKGFPKNINVSALLSLAGVGFEKTKVRIISSPEYNKNIHEICVESKAGKFTFRTENVPFPSNPKTSYLAALSAMAALGEYLSSIRVGT